MRLIPALLPVVFVAGCCSGNPASVAPAAKVAYAPTQTFGFRPEVKSALTIPVDTLGCVANTGTKIVGDIIDGARCVLDTLVPVVVPSNAAAAAAGPACGVPVYRSPSAECGK